MAMTDYCGRCSKVVEVKRIEHATCTEWRCVVCDSRTDVDFNDGYEDDDVLEPT